MSILHTVNKSTYERDTLEACVRLASKGGSVLLIEDGVYAALKGSKYSSAVEEAMKNKTVYALGPDLSARGIQEKVLEGVKVVDYGGFVDLVAENDTVQSWL